MGQAKDKYLEDTPEIHDSIEWGGINRPITPENFAAIVHGAVCVS